MHLVLSAPKLTPWVSRGFQGKIDLPLLDSLCWPENCCKHGMLKSERGSGPQGFPGTQGCTRARPLRLENFGASSFGHPTPPWGCTLSPAWHRRWPPHSSTERPSRRPHARTWAWATLPCALWGRACPIAHQAAHQLPPPPSSSPPAPTPCSPWAPPQHHTPK